MIGASSEDIRLDDTFTVIDSIEGANDVLSSPTKVRYSVASDPSDDSATNVLNHDKKSIWTGSKGHTLTISLLQSDKVEEIKIVFDNKSKNLSKYKIRLSKGGGQFIDFISKVYNGKTHDGDDEITIPVGQSGISDVQLHVESGELVIQYLDL